MKANVNNRVVELKTNATQEKPFKIAIQNEKGLLIGFLQIIDQRRACCPDLIQALTKWRNLSRRSFFTQFEASIERTSKWLNEVVIPSSDRLLFEVLDLSGNSVGQAGLCSISDKEAELDNFIRGEIGGDRALFKHAELALLKWVFFVLDIPLIKLYIFSTNTIPLGNHIALGFQVVAEHSLTTVLENGVLRHMMDTVCGQPVNYKYVKMEMVRSAFDTQ
jgi:hypothetical protein